MKLLKETYWAFECQTCPGFEDGGGWPNTWLDTKPRSKCPKCKEWHWGERVPEHITIYNETDA